MSFPRSIMRETITVYRKSGGYYDENDRWVDGTEEAYTHNYTSVQPTSARDLQMLPEGERIEGAVKIYDVERLYAQDTGSGNEADIVEHNGKFYKVVTVDAWQQGILDHYKAYATLLREDTGA